MSSSTRQRIAAAFSAQNRQRVVAEAATRIIAEAAARNGQPPTLVIVDGRPGAALASVNPDHGRIEVRFNLLRDVLAWIAQQLVTHSPVDTGAFSRSHTWLADGQPFDLGNLPEARAYQVLSLVPYARQIERGESKAAPEGVYEVVAVLAQRRFGNVAAIDFSFRSPVSDYIAGGANRAGRAALRAQPERLAAMRQERATRVPAITITPR